MNKIPFNPYIVGNPIKTKDMFFGREDDFQYVIKKLGTGRSNQIIIFCGDRRSGKTSILFQILLGRLGGDFLPILIDMQILAGIKNDRDFYRSIIDVACTQLNLPNITLATLENENKDDSEEGLFKCFITLIEEKYPDKLLLFLLDEYELIETKIKDGSLSEHVIHFLAGILESSHHISFIFTGSTNLENRKVDYWKILLGKSIYRKISYLSQNDTRRLITQPLKKYIHYSEKIVSSLYRLTGGQPFYTQVMCQNIVDLLMEEERNEPTREDLKIISKDIINNPLPQMIYSWNNLTDYVRLVLSALSGVLEGADAWTGAREVYGYLKKNKIPLPFKKGHIHILLEEAYHKEFLKKNDRGLYCFRMDIFRQWIKKEHSIWKVVKEIGIKLKKPVNPIFAALVSGISVIAVVIFLFFIPWDDIIGGGSSATPTPHVETVTPTPTPAPTPSPTPTPKPTPKPTRIPEIKGSIRISSVPAETEIILDGENTGETTPAYLMELNRGEHTLELVLEGYKTEVVTITIDSSETEEREVLLTKAIGFLILKIRPNAFVYFNNIEKIILEENTSFPIETPRAKALNIQAGTHTLTIIKDILNFERIVTIEIYDNRTTIIDWDIENQQNPIIKEE